jgi:hypothetical protein
MAGFTDATTVNLTRTQVFSSDITTLLLDDLNAMQFVRTLNDFPDGFNFNIPIVGEAEVAYFNEGQAMKYQQMDTGNFQFNFTDYVYSGNSMSEKFRRDSWLSPQIIALFPQRQHRALMEYYETRVWAVGNAGQTASNLNTINGASHRWVAGAVASNGTQGMLTFQDFAKARFALTKSNVPLRNLVAIVDPSTAYSLETQTNVTNLLTPAGQWQSVTREGLTTGFKYRFNVYGFDIYESNYLPSSISETINSVSVTNGVANYFFDATPGDTLPWVGAWRQMPTVQSKFDMDLQQWDYATICEFGLGFFREQNFVTVLTSKSVVPS